MIPEDAHLNALLGSAGKTLAAQPAAKELVARFRTADSREDLRELIRTVDLGLGDRACDAIMSAVDDGERWREVHATLVRSAEQQLIERYSPSS